MSLSLDLRFTDPAAPLFIDIEGDNSESLFVISTSQVHGAVTGAPTLHYQSSNNNNKKRDRQNSPTEIRNKRPMKAVQVVDRVAPPSHSYPRSAPVTAHRSDQEASSSTVPPHSERGLSREPLFLPTSSQLSVAHEEAVRSSGLGVENMDADELVQMLDGDGEEVAFDFSSQRPPNEGHQTSQRYTRDETEYSDSFDLQIEEGGFEPTQVDSSRASLPSSPPSETLSSYAPCRCSNLCSRINDDIPVQ
jgi:cell cycle checkpoint control protein RAD9A